MVSVSLRVRDSNKRLKPIATWRDPTAIDIRVCGKNRFRLLDLNMIEVKNNKSAVLKERIIIP